MMDHLFDVRAGDEITYGKLRGVRFWTYQFVDPSGRNPPCTICSFQHDHEWIPSRPTQSEGELPTIENGRGLNVYKTVDDAMRGSADAIHGVIENLEGWYSSTGGIVLGEVEFWGPCVEYEFIYAAQYVQPSRFVQAWGYKPWQIVDDLNLLWFAPPDRLSFEEEVLLAVQRGGAISAADIGFELQLISKVLSDLESKGFVSWKRSYDFDGKWKQQLEMAWNHGVCLSCNRPARADGACAARMPRLWQITTTGQIALLTTIRQRGENHV